METIESISNTLNDLVWGTGIPVGEETIPLVVIALLGTGFLLTFRLGFVQLRRLAHGFAVTSGKYDDPNEPGDVSHFQALTTALSATVGIGNIAGVAIAIHWGGPGALFWMWATALLGMATKFSEVTLAQRYRSVTATDKDAHKWEGTVSGGPMYYIERGLGRHWKPLAVLFAGILGVTAFLTGNAIQANTVADTFDRILGIPGWATGLITTTVVAMVILGGITRIGRVTGILAPLMAAIYVFGALAILVFNFQHIVPAVLLVFREAFNPTAGVAGTGTGALLVTMMWGVKRGLFSNEAGQGSAPIAHAAAKTDEPVSEGVVALVEPFIDTLVICTMTAMVIIITGVYEDRIPTEINLSGGDLTWVTQDPSSGRFHETPDALEPLRVEGGKIASPGAVPAWHEAPVGELFTDAAQTLPFTGVIDPARNLATADDGSTFGALHADAAENGAPLTMLGFEKGLGRLGRYIVVLSVLLFAVSTAIAWSYYGDRCANYLFGARAIMPYKLAFVVMHFVGAVLPLTVVWEMGDIFLGMVIIPNLLALVLLSGQVKEMASSYFQRRPWLENAEVHKKFVADKRTPRGR
jgi:AGCS family alanine or glycine:cation symporter